LGITTVEAEECPLSPTNLTPFTVNPNESEYFISSIQGANLLEIQLIDTLRKKGFFHLLSANFLTQLLAFGTSLLVAKFLNPVELGETKILQSYVVLFMVFAGSGFNSVALKYCSEERTQQNKEFLLRFSFISTLMTTSLVLLIMASLARYGIITQTPRLSTWLMIFAIIIPFNVITDLLTIYLQAQKKIKEMSRVQAINRIIIFILVVACTALWGFSGFILGSVAAGILGVVAPFYNVKLGFFNAPHSSLPNTMYSLALFGALAASVTSLGLYGDIFILDHFVSNRVTIGYYSLATYFTLAAMQVTMTIQTILIPYFSLHWQDKAWYEKNLARSQLLTSLLSIVISAGILVAAWLLIRFVYGPSYQSTLIYLIVLILRYILFSSYAIISAALVGLGLVRFNFLAVAISTPLGLLLSYFMQINYGALGVAWAQVAGALITLVIELFLIRIALKNHFKSPVPITVIDRAS
jgi:O-antigen/teichoic acid export membrane protein